MKNSASLRFPFKEDNENNCLKRAHTVEATIISAIRAYLVTPPGSRVGNMVGCFLSELLYQLIPSNNLESYAIQLRGDLIEQFPGVEFVSVSMERDITGSTVDLIVKISFSVLTAEKIIDMEVVLPSIFSTENINNISNIDI